MLARRMGLCAWVLMSLVLGCGTAHEKAHTGAISGFVSTAQGSVLPGATVTHDLSATAVQTDANGAFSLPQALVGKTVLVKVHADGYADIIRQVQVSGSAADVLHLPLRPYKTGTITLPQAGQAPATFAADALGGQATLIIPPLSLATPDGAIATGEATVSMTYWSYRDWQGSSPLGLTAQNQDPNGAPMPLVTYGMADMKVSQHGVDLVVAPNQTLQLQFGIAPYQHSLLKALVEGDTYAPNFYSGDANTGLWVKEGKLSDGKLVFDANAMTFTGTMTHMSAWNLDGCHLDYGGCVAGTLVGADGTSPVPNANVRIWLLTRDEIKDYIVQTDSAGNYCQNLGTNEGTTSVNYFLSAPDDVAQSNMCNPMPTFCSTCLGDNYWGNMERWCTHCAMRNDAVCQDTDNGDINGQIANQACGPYPVCNKDSSAAQVQGSCYLTDEPEYGYTDSCSPATPLVTIQPCAWCPGTPLPASCSGTDYRTGASFNVAPNTDSCGALKPLSFTPGVYTVTPPQGTSFVSVCQGATAQKYVGQSCQSNADCCQTATGLVCQDLLCVPAKDNT